ncbi:monovalent cation/H(+) antiporter subunit G [Aeromicrobium sp. YIM 150415]|uniref:monovalent cation/H(+) antiporter subunit G n=1 Tax=Aeromicrobium sp. YIM 150415 TaxID=2803912 RepID=UPI001966A158|nr:monovalent cation/H(+) antiporter subunit G [Aeromicrobium sp. YIM 150415]MBM9464747.1 monovalent cation/H(+) antiporter subunit G [Aeromicrobium sp. YIM 150415]
MIDYIAGALLILGASFALVAGIGILRFPELLTRMHAATKPQTLGLLLILAGLALRAQDLGDITVIVVVAIFQMLTAPVSAHMVGRASFRTGFVDKSRLNAIEIPDQS